MVAALICARGGSKRIYRKNLQYCGGKRLLEWPLITALGSKYIDKVYLSSEDEEIKEIGRQYKVNIIDRPWQMATDKASNASSTLHSMREIYKMAGNYEHIVLLWPTSPLIEAWQVDEAYQQLASNPMADTITTINRFPKTSQLGNFYTLGPYNILFNLWGIHGMPAQYANNLFDVYFINGAMSIIKLEMDWFDGLPDIKEDSDPLLMDYIYADRYNEREAKKMMWNRIKTIGYITDESSAFDINWPEDLIIADGIFKYRQGLKEGKTNGQKT